MNSNGFLRASAYPIEQLIEETGQRAYVLHRLMQSGDAGVSAKELGMPANSLAARIKELRDTYNLSIFAVLREVPDRPIQKGTYTRFYLKTHTIVHAWHDPER